MTATTDVEGVVAAVWADVLGVERVAPTDGFFALGGYSQQAVRAVHLLRDRLGVAVTLRDLMSAATLADFTAAVRARAEAGAPARPVVRLTGRRGTR
ncbi:phosphopantetheine-binding protein [Lentzea jiangxiensis]|uniref:Phosphopantetheine attachment site n=1 Tax=Lentzea jiangxiensis TaxID=641025 RepID=A0A1H0JPM1_9PSEU|nr:phosphopantetheine-binding protein [Lentzea jiangxiensis]SDO45513.1 Phosphopantetheine attachment site [Lentzea jiangxiensis]